MTDQAAAIAAVRIAWGVERTCELSRRAGFAVAEITEAMGFLEDTTKSDARYWAMKALIRARDMLTSGSAT
jgi:hypothetical protein